MESCSDAFHTKRHKKHLKKLMMICAELTNLDPSSETNSGPSSETNSEDLAIICWRWSLTPSLMLMHVMHVKSTVTLSIKNRDVFTQHPPYGHLRYREWMWLGLSALQHPENIAITDYFSKWAKAVPLKEVKTPNVFKLIKHHVLYRFSVPRRIIYVNGPQFVS